MATTRRFELGEILDRLGGVDELSTRAMFGGHALYSGGTVCALFFAGRLYFKVDETSKRDFESRGTGPFRPNGRQTLKSYHEVPPAILANRRDLLSWPDGDPSQSGRGRTVPRTPEGRGDRMPATTGDIRRKLTALGGHVASAQSRCLRSPRGLC